MCISHQPFDARLIAEQADLTICYAGHGTICRTLLAGKPLLVLPTTVEQYLNGATLTALHAGEMGNVSDPGQVNTALDAVSSRASYRFAAQEFAARYAFASPPPVANQVVEHLEALANQKKDW